MHMHRSIRLLAAALFVCMDALAAPPPAMDKQLDGIYLALGRGDTSSAIQNAAALLAQTTPHDRRRAQALQAEIDALTQGVALNKPPGLALAETIQADTANNPQEQALAGRLAIAQALERNDVKIGLQLAQVAQANATTTPEDQRELYVLLARAAAMAPGHLDLAKQQAQLAMIAWQPLGGAQARWHEVELYYIIANVYAFTGSQRDALTELESGLRLAIGFFGADSLERFKLDADRAAVMSSMGRQREAMEIRESLVTQATARYGATSFEVAKAEGLLGASLQEIGDYPSASAHYAHAQSLVAALPDAPPFDRGLITANYANLLQEMGEEEKALGQYRQALALWGDGDATMHARAIVSANIGNTEFKLQHYETAMEDFQRALALREKSDGPDAPGLAYSLEGLGSSSLALRRYAEAEGYYRRALALRGKALAPNHPTIAPLQFGLALARWGQGDEADAFQMAVKTAQFQQDMLATFAADFSERQSVAYRELLVPATALAVTLAARRTDAESTATAWRLAMTERGLVARTEAHRLAAARAQSDPELAKVWEVWRKANSALGEAWMGKDVSAEHMVQLRTDAENAERALWRHAGQHDSGVAQSVVSVADLAHSLPADSLLIAYVEGVADDPARQVTAGDKPDPEDWYAFALGNDAKPRLRRVGNVKALSAQARAWYLDLRNPASDPNRLRREGEPLRQALLDPLLATAHVQRLFIVPEGELYRLSFAALPDGDDGYLVEAGTRVHTLVNEADLILPAVALETSNTLLAGAPEFPSAVPAAPGSARQLCLRAAREGFAAIPNAGRELDDLNALLAASSTKLQIKLIRGADATKQNVLDALPQASIVHLATHGFSMDDSCAEPSGSRGVTLDPGSSAETGRSKSESALSGLAFSGATVTAGQSPVGVLSAGELATLDLSRVAWIALSACDSGLGPIGRNEGVFGMRRALRLAGARTVVMSLWQVDDAATADLMASLYRERFVEHADVPEAMAAAMRSVIASRRAAGQSDHPYYWAAFIGEGGWR